jgi:hypothetical protein
MQQTHNINIAFNKRKRIFYPIFIIAALGILVAFTTAISYRQLIIAAILYPLLVYFGLILFPRKATGIYPQEISTSPSPVASPSANKNKENPVVVDLNKRALLKLVASVGISYFVYSLISNRAQGLIMGKAPDSGIVTLQKPDGGTIHPAETQPTDGYQITEIDEGEISYFGFVDTESHWFIMREDIAGSFRYTKGESDFPNSWGIRANLKYDYYHKVFP